MTIPPVAYAALASWGVALMLCVNPEWGVMCAIASAGMVFAFRRHRMVLCLALSTLVVAASVALQAATHLAKPHSGPEHFELTLTSGPSRISRASGEVPRFRADAELRKLDGRDVHLRATVFGALPENAAWGDSLTGEGQLEPRRGDGPARLTLTISSIQTHHRAEGPLGFTRDLRQRFLEDASRLPSFGGELVPGLAIGITTGISEALAEAMRDASLTHLTAVSGANCAGVLAATWWMLALCGARRAARIVGSLAALGGFVLLVTPEPSVIRAAVMAALALLALIRGSVIGGVAMLGITVCIVLGADPWLAWNLGFALSVSATAGILLLGPALHRLLSDRVGPGVALAIAVPLAAHLACQPLIMMLSPSINLWSVPVNIIAGWCAPLASVLGVTACLVLGWADPVAHMFVWLASLPADIIAHLAFSIRGFPGAHVPLPPGVLAVGVAIAFLASIALATVTQSTRLRLLGVALGITMAAVVAGTSIVAPGIRSGSRPENWRIAACPVGQGDAFLVRENGEVMLIDTGPEPRALRTCLDTLGVSHIDVLVLTHYDRDHVGGLDAVTGRVSRALVGPVGDAHGQSVRNALASGGASVTEVHRGDRGELGEVPYRVLWPNGSTEPGNDSSIVVSLEGPQWSGLFLGDLGAEAQAALVRAGVPRNVDVVKVAHHGSADQDDGLYAAIHARLGLIGVGVNRYGHPTARLLDLLRGDGIPYLRTDREGLSLVEVGADRSLELWTERGSAPER
ncbi:MAG TPA: ComEC/Rec2 family competence protein [Microbacteriaceae bacterium]|nr:ComEC/Rec2 family competence protein [Microbacteriaceae bacterium]